VLSPTGKPGTLLSFFSPAHGSGTSDPWSTLPQKAQTQCIQYWTQHLSPHTTSPMFPGSPGITTMGPITQEPITITSCLPFPLLQ
jgi:hypothetical protein